MRKARWLANWRNSVSKPVIDHCIPRLVYRRFVFRERECEAFRMFMRMNEDFSGCRILSDGLMSNHLHLMQELLPLAGAELSDEVLLQDLSGLCPEAFVGGAAELAEAGKAGLDARIAGIHGRFT